MILLVFILMLVFAFGVVRFYDGLIRGMNERIKRNEDARNN